MKRKASSQKQKTDSSKKLHLKGAKNIITLGLPYLIFSLLVISLVAIVLYYMVIVGPGAQKNKMFVDTTLRSYIDSVLVKMDAAQEYVQKFANNQQVINAVIARDSAQIKLLEQELTRQLPYAVGTKILLPDVLTQDITSKPPITNAVLEVVRKTAQEKSSHPEVIMPGTEQQFILLTAVVKNNDQVIATVVFGMEQRVISETLKRIHSIPGYIELWQNFYNNNHKNEENENNVSSNEPCGRREPECP